MTEKKRGRGRPKGAPNKPLMDLPTERTNLTMNADVYEILGQANLVEEVDKQAHGLKVYNDRNGAVSKVLKWAFDENINSTLPEGPTPYGTNQSPATDLTETSLRFEHKLFKYFVTEELPQLKREQMWVAMLEGIPAKEAEMMDLIHQGKFPFKNISEEAVKMAFPELLG
jgi:hypothetical protein